MIRTRASWIVKQQRGVTSVAGVSAPGKHFLPMWDAARRAPSGDVCLVRQVAGNL